MREKKHFKTIIIGGGVAGLMCAHELAQKGDYDFLVLTKDVGGRVLLSDNKATNYGAYFVTQKYTNLMPFITITRKIKKTDISFEKAGKRYGMFNWRMAKNALAYARLVFLMIQFRKRFDVFRHNCLHMSQKIALESDKFLHELYFTKASSYFKKERLHDLVGYYLDEMANSMSFSYPGNASAFLFLQWASEMLMNSLYEFNLSFEKMACSFKERIVITEVVDLTRYTNGYALKCSNGNDYESTNVVIATEPWQAKKFYDIEYESNISKSYMRHIAGVPRSQYSTKSYILFPSRAEITVIAKQSDGTYIVYSDDKDTDLSQCFIEYKVIKERWWDPAFLYFHRSLVEASRGEGLYAIGSFNIDGLEDCAITGIWAARQILKKEGFTI